MKAEYRKGCPQRDSAEHKEYAGAQSVEARKRSEQGGAKDLLEEILDKRNLFEAYKRVKDNRGAPGIDGMTVEAVLPWLQENVEELRQKIREGKYKPDPVRRAVIPKPDGSGERMLGIPTVIDRILQQAIALKLTPIFEPVFADESYGYRPDRNCQKAMARVKEYADEGYIHVAEVDLSKYFDTLNHELLMNLVRQHIQDKRVTQLIKSYLKSGVMEKGVVTETEEGSPQGGPLSPLLANIYLNQYDWEMKRRGVAIVRYADDIVVLARSQRAAERLLESSRKYLEEKLKLKLNQEKSRAISIYSRKFKFLGYAMGKNKNGNYIRAHKSSLKKAKQKLKEKTRRNRGKNVREVMKEVKAYITGWLNHYYIASIKNTLIEWDKWLRRRLRMYIWKQWKKPRTRVDNLRKLGIPAWQAYQWGNSRLGYWRIAGSPVLSRSITNEKLVQAGYFEILNQYERMRKH
ncbi:group II intron reverse transcriptase/maturase [Proteiniclasticum sp. QWL-01]|uniref:group II intron reverse transcriptase/maturase n=1 Tax=Proteiniclasticum sp. QWL-01 TaxID=3036945 RepID=UPI002410B607|nr:group II intron reverse transcriptase/maturase [Proteiniclasticum sp. QWL-01]WFF72524.1 group II intron reverse transcriptase/maturase [Proteiniclasticum sp. QWL-01]